MEHLEAGHFYRFQSTIYEVKKVYRDEKWGNHYRIREVAYHDSSRIVINTGTKTSSLADGLDGVTKAEEDLHSFLVWVLTQDYEVIYADTQR